MKKIAEDKFNKEKESVTTNTPNVVTVNPLDNLNCKFFNAS